MGCLLGPAVLWAAILGVADRNSAFFWNWYSPDLLQGLVLPAQPDSEAAMLLRLQHQMGIRLIYTCQCGMPYGIGECGQAMEQGRCPNCGAVIGGQNHRLADPGQDRRLGQTQPLTGFGPDRPESGHTERGLAPHVYRFVQLLLLLPLVVWFPEHHHAADLRRRLDLNLQGLARNLGITNDEAAQLTARVLADGKDRLLLPGLRFSGEEQLARQAEAQLVESLRGACPDFVDRPMEVLRRVRRDLEAAGDQLRPIEFLREVELGKLHPAQRLANFASGLLRLPSDTQAALEWEMLSDGDRAALPITSMFQGGTNWEQRARDIQRLRPLVVGWAALHLSTHLQGLTSKTRHLDECIKDGAVASEFVKAWNDLASAGGVEYECQRNLQLPQISMETSAETCHLGPDGTLAQAMFMTLLKVHNEAMKQAKHACR
ncbi:unnamed protein product [Polarella glacialis]|uniref:RZ-type domain-containing protein n=1 Tax=Polarella glacialis TaxID=89957 RepID=A0A813K907_POLGL|nr:unnamed protein product [Polarella glacialis]